MTHLPQRLRQSRRALSAVLAALIACTVAIVAACDPAGPLARAPRPIDPDSTLTSFSFGWGDFHEGHRHIRIEPDGDGHRLWVNWETHDRTQFFVPEGVPLGLGEADALLALLDEQGIVRWDGYNSTFTDENTSDFSFALTFTLSDGRTIYARGANEFGGRPTPEFSAEFTALAAHVRGIAERHDEEPDWGRVESFSLTFGWSDPISYSISRAVDQADGRYAWADDRFTLSVRRGGGSDPQLAEVGPEVLDELQALIEQLGVTDWRDGIPGAPSGGHLDEGINVYVTFDSGLHVSAHGSARLAPNEIDGPVWAWTTDSEELTALANFFEETWATRD